MINYLQVYFKFWIRILDQ